MILTSSVCVSYKASLTLFLCAKELNSLSKKRLKTHQGATVLHWITCFFITVNKLQRPAILRSFSFWKRHFYPFEPSVKTSMDLGSHKLLKDILTHCWFWDMLPTWKIYMSPLYHGHLLKEKRRLCLNCNRFTRQFNMIDKVSWYAFDERLPANQNPCCYVKYGTKMTPQKSVSTIMLCSIFILQLVYHKECTHFQC